MALGWPMLMAGFGVAHGGSSGTRLPYGHGRIWGGPIEVPSGTRLPCARGRI